MLKVKNWAEAALGEYFQFIGRLHDNVHKEIMKNHYDVFQVVHEATLNLEIIQQDNKPSKAIVLAAIDSYTPEQDFDADKLDAINAVQAPKGQSPFQPQKKSNSNKGTSNDDSNKSCCRYCNLFGHMQKECNKRKAAEAPMVNTQGKPYAPQVSVVQNWRQAAQIVQSNGYLN
jgi:hypothetical protein